MYIKEALKLINVLDISENKRKYYYNYSNVLVNEQGEIVAVFRYKNKPSDKDYNKDHALYPGTVQFTACPGWYKNEDELQKAVFSCVESIKDTINLKKAGKLDNVNMVLKMKSGSFKSIRNK